jgi:Pectate lyase superfamily protein
MTHIQIPNIVPRIQYTGNGSQTQFSYPFPIFNASHLHVFFNGAEILSGFTVMNAGSSTGGTVVFDTAPASGITLTFERILPLQRISDFIEGGELSANALNNEFDYLTGSIQQLNDAQHAMLHFTKTEALPVTELPSKAARANKTLGFDSDGALKLHETSATYTTPSYTQSGTGAVARTLTDKAKEHVSVKDFGAVGDNVADDTIAIQNAIAAHANIYFPSGTYRLTASIEIGTNKIIQGAGSSTILKAVTNTFDPVTMIGKNSQLANLVIEGGESAVRLYGKTSPCVTNIIQHLTIRNAAIGIELDGYTNTANPCDGNTLSNIVIEQPTQYGVLVTRSGIGKYPNANKFTNIRVTSLGTPLSGAGFFLEAAKYNTSLINCEALIAGTPSACIRIGPGSDKTLLCNIYCEGSNSVPNIVLDNGSTETSIINLFSNSTGAAIEDYSGGNYLAFNAGFPAKTRLNRTSISDLTTSQQRYTFETVAFASPNTVIVDLSKTLYMINAANAVTTVQLPKAAIGNSGAVITVKKTDASANAVSITENSGSGPDGRTHILGSQHDIVCMISDGAVWRVAHTNIPSFNANYVSGVTSYSPDITRQVHAVSASGGLTTVTLPPANNAGSIGRFLTIKKIDSSANAVRIVESGAVGPDNAIVNLTAQYAAITVMSNGSTWYTIGKV